MNHCPNVLDTSDVELVGLPDVQASDEAPDIRIEAAGISGLRLPAHIIDVDGRVWDTIIEALASVSVPGRRRGTHMSRFVAFLEEQRAKGINLDSLIALLGAMLPMLDADAGSLEMRFKCFLPKRAPVSGMEGLLDVEAAYRAVATLDEEAYLTQSLTVPVMTLCPCSKAISAYGAHNQRTLVTVDLEGPETLAISQLADLIESCSSSPLYPILKRADEKYVTERSYEKPRFVEDVAREVYEKARACTADTRVTVRVESQESIHNHQAFAVVDTPAESTCSAP